MVALGSVLVRTMGCPRVHLDLEGQQLPLEGQGERQSLSSPQAPVLQERPASGITLDPSRMLSPKGLNICLLE